jgi:acyl-CoA synthetase (AMP-forming)/AMP-acid ligase II
VDFLATWSLGAVWVPINPAYGDAERAHILADCAPALLLHDDAAVVMPPAPDVAPVIAAGGADALALLIYTSGTTGKSKGCALTQQNVIDATRALMARWHMSERDVLVHALPLFHVHGLCVALVGALLSGARVVLLPRFDVDAVARAFAPAPAGESATVFMGVPTMYRRLLDALQAPGPAAQQLAHALRGARAFMSGSAPLPAADFAAFHAATGHEIVERYGMSETLITLSNPLDPREGPRKPGTVGTPLAGVHVRIVDDELWVRGPGVMRGYWNDAAGTARTFVEEDGARWLKTGDAAAIDDDGYVTIRGRLTTDFVKVGGYKVSTREVEDALRTHPRVADVAVVGVPDREWGERLVACVVPSSPSSSLSSSPSSSPGGAEAPAQVALLAELQAHAALAPHKLPRALLVVDALPKNAMGKVQKRVLASRAAVEATPGDTPPAPRARS